MPCVPLSFDRHFMLLWKGSKLRGESQKRTDEDGSGAEEIGSQAHQNSEFTHYEARSDHKYKDNVLQELLYANVSETTDLTSEKELPSDRANSNAYARESADIDNILEEPEEAMETNDDKSSCQVEKHATAKGPLDINATAVIGSVEAVLEFDRLWQEAINSNEVVILDKSEADLDSVLKKVESRSGDNEIWDNTLDSWNEKPSAWADNESSETDEYVDDDENTLGTWRVTRLSPGREVAEYEEDDKQLEENSSAGQLLPSSLTDVTIPQTELKRLCALGLAIRGWLKIGTPGITGGIVKSIHRKWLVSEIAKVRCIVPGWNMKEVHDDLEVSYYIFKFFTCLPSN